MGLPFLSRLEINFVNISPVGPGLSLVNYKEREMVSGLSINRKDRTPESLQPK